MAYTDIDKPSDYFNTVLHSGDNSSPEPISGFGFQPDWIWTKCRTAAYDHSISDSVRGANKTIRSNNTSAEVSNDVYGNLTAFNSDGFTATTGSSSINYYNQSGQTYVNWGWKAGTSFTNDASATGIGSIDSTGSVNTDAGFSIISYTGTGSAATVAHGLGVAPAMIIIKNRSTTNGWEVYHQSIGNTKYLALNVTDAALASASRWNNTSPTSTVFTVNTENGVNKSGSNLIAYCFAEKQGYSKFGSYTGNGSTDGIFVYTGFKPAWLVAKRTNDTGAWYTVDNKRDTFNVTHKWLDLNSSDAENTSSAALNVDFLSNGFKNRTSNNSRNGSGQSYIYMAFAENPFTTSTGIPATAK